MYFLHQEFLSKETLLTISFLMAGAGLLASKGAMDLYASLLLFALAGIFFLMHDYFPPTLVYIIAIALAVAAIFSQRDLSRSNYTLQMMLLGTVLFFCKLYLVPKVLLNVALITIVVLAFIFLI